MTSGSDSYLTIRALVEAASRVTGVPVATILGPRRPHSLVIIRACIAHLANAERLKLGNFRDSRWSLPRIAKGLAYGDHTSVMHLIAQWPAYCQIRADLPELAAKIRAEALRASAGGPEPEHEAPSAEQQHETPPAEQQDEVLDVPPSTYRKPKNDFRASDPADADAGHVFHARMAKASALFAARLLEAKEGIATSRCTC